MKLIEAIKEWGLDKNLESMTELDQRVLSTFDFSSKQSIDDAILDLIMEPIKTASQKESEMFLRYIFQVTVQVHGAGKDTDKELVMPLVHAKVTKLMKNQPWLFEVAIETVEVKHEDGTIEVKEVVKKKSGAKSKKEQAIELWKTVADKNMARKELIELFVKELELTPSGASTYVHNCKSGLWK